MKLSNYRRFNKLEVEFHPSLTVIAARNGQGKTTVLEAVAAAIGPFVGGFDEGHAEHLKHTDVHRRPVGSGFENEVQYPVTVTADVAFDTHLVSSTRELSGKKSRTTRSGAAGLTKTAKSLQAAVRNGEDVDLPVVVYYSSQRLAVSGKNTGNLTKKILTASRMASYDDCLTSGVSSFAQLEAWVMKATQVAAEERRDSHSNSPSPRRGARQLQLALDGVCAAVNQVLSEEGWRDFRYSNAHEVLTMVHDDHGVLPVSMLSDGVRAVIALSADLAVRCARLNGHYGADAALRSRGIVLIDEVDLHLHPAWQQRIVGGLQSAFPKLQFIVTTHSPQVISTVERESIIEIYETVPGVGVATHPAEEVVGLKSSVALSEVMKVNPTPDVPAAEDLSKYQALVEEGLADSPEGQELRSVLIERYGAGHSEIAKFDAIIRLRTFKSRMNTRGSNA